MKRMMIGMALVLFTLGAAHAQEKQQKTPAERAKYQTEHMTKELALDPDQVSKVQAINAKYAEKAQALRAERQANAAAMKGKGAAMMDARMAELNTVLTPEQYAKCEKNMEEMKAKRMEKRKQMKADDKQ